MAAETDFRSDLAGTAPESPGKPVDPPAEPPVTDSEQSLPDGYEPV